MTTEARHLGTMLLQEGLLTRTNLDRASEIQAESGLPLGRDQAGGQPSCRTTADNDNRVYGFRHRCGVLHALKVSLRQ